MSRIGKQPVQIPSGVKASLDGRTITIESSSARLSMERRPEVKVAWDEDEKNLVVSIDPKDQADRKVRAYWGMTRAMLRNMVEGVTKGYEKKMEVNGAGWGAAIQGARLELKLGFASPVYMDIPAGLDVSVERNVVTIKGADRQQVGQFAAEMRAKRKPEPYNGKGVKYADEILQRKQGKVFGS